MDVASVVEKLEQLDMIRINRIINSYYSIYCPFHNDGNEKKPSFGILLQSEIRNNRLTPAGWCHCFSCSYVNTLPGMISDILKNRGLTTVTAVEWLIENIPGFNEKIDFEFLIPPDMSEDMINKWDNSARAARIIKDMTKPKYEYVSEEELASYRFTVPYMYERKLTDWAIQFFDVGFDKNFKLPGRKEVTPTLTFPVRDESGRTQFIYRRGVNSKIFYMPSGLIKPVYGIYEIGLLPERPKSLIICEAIINCITCWIYGYPAVALMATGNATQIDQLRKLGVSSYVICTDGDEAGTRAANKLKKSLKDVAIIWRIHMPSDKDVNDCSKEEFDMLYAAKE